MTHQLYLCRHGETAWNAERRFQGQVDIPLDALGRIQAKRNGRYLRNVLGNSASEFGFLSSPLGRSVETMRIIRYELGLEPDDFARDDRLKEVHFGDWQGSTLTELEARLPGVSAQRSADKWNFLPPGPGAETLADLERRVAPVFEGFDRPMIVTAHGGVTRAYLRRFAGWSEREAARIDVPQDRILAITGEGRVDWV